MKTRRHFFRLIVVPLLAMALGATPALAADYHIPSGGTLPANCALTSAALVTCTALNLNNADRIIVTAPVILQVSGNFSYGQNVRVNEGGDPSSLTFNVTGSWSGGNGGHFIGNLNVASITLNQNSIVGGTITASGNVSADSLNNLFSGNIVAGGSVTLGQDNRVTGSINSTGGGLTTRNRVEITGSVAVTGNIQLNQGSSVGGSVTTTDGTLTTQNNVNMGGGVSVWGTISMAENNHVANGGITSDTGNISIATGSVNGDISAPNGGFTTSNPVAITGSVNVSGNLSLGKGTTVTGDVTGAGTFRSYNEVIIDGQLTIDGNIVLGHESEVGGNVLSRNGSVASHERVQIGGNVDAGDGIDLGFQTVVGGSLETPGGVTLKNEVEISGSISAGGNVRLGYQSDVDGDVDTEGGVTAENEVRIGGNIKAGGNVFLDWLSRVEGNINTPGKVSGNNTGIGGYINAGDTDGTFVPVDPGSGPVTICDTDPELQDSNYSPCPGYESEPTVHHYRMTFAGTALTCEPLPVVVQACADGACSSLVPLTDTISVVAANAAPAASAPATFAGSGETATALVLTTPGTYTLSLSNLDVPAAEAPRCDPLSCQTELDDAVFSWRWPESPPENVIPTQVAGQPFSVQLLAQGCATTFQNQTVPVDLSLQCDDPASCSAGGTLLKIDGTPLSAAPGAVSLPLNFDAASATELAINYDDAGRITLHASANLPGGASISGASNSFVVRPALIGFEVSNPLSYTDPMVFARAGDDLTVVLSARSTSPGFPITPNFGNESTPARLTLQGEAAVVGPNPGVSTGPIFVLDPFIRNAPGTFTSTRVRYGEVGTARFSARLVDGDYLGTGDLVMENSIATGLFIPWEFSVNDGSVTPACEVPPGGFTYMGQDFLLSFTASAWARYGNDNLGIVLNYAGDLAVASVSLSAANLADGSDLSDRLNYQAPWAAWTAGEAGMTHFPVRLDREAATGPYESVQLAVSLEQPGTSLRAPDFNAAVMDCADTDACNAVAIGDPTKVVLGRLVLSDTYGPETSAVEVSAEAQYWNGDRWVRAANTTAGIQDNCSAIDPTRLQAIEGALGDSTAAGYSTSLHNGRNPVESLSWSAPGLPGEFFFRYDLGNPGDPDSQTWLRSIEEDAPRFDEQGNPTARATFGTYRGHDRIINWQILPLP